MFNAHRKKKYEKSLNNGSVYVIHETDPRIPIQNTALRIGIQYDLLVSPGGREDIINRRVGIEHFWEN